MIALDFIAPNFPTLRPNDSVGKALQFMDEYKSSELPVVENGLFRGIVREQVLENSDEQTAIIDLPLENIFVGEYQHFWEVLRVFSATTMAVVGTQMEYKGIIQAQALSQYLSKSYSAQRQGGIIVVAMPEKDYSMHQISRIVEAENTKILASYLETDKQNRLVLTLKLDTENLMYIVASLERFGFDVIARFQENQNMDIHKERLGNLLRFLEL